MNNRDPFNLRQSPAFNIIRGTASQATQRVLEASSQVYETGKQAVEEMAFQPKNVPTFTAPQRDMDNRVWGASGVTARSANAHQNGGVMNEVQNRVGDFFERGRGDLPMYKDKPYSYASSRRQRPAWKRKRNLGIAGLVALFVLYFTGAFSGDSSTLGVEKSKGWGWLSTPEEVGLEVDWLERREKVKEAFTLSWDAYERQAWGTRILLAFYSRNNAKISQDTMNSIQCRNEGVRWLLKAWAGSLSTRLIP